MRLSPAEHVAWVAAARGAGRGRLGSWVRDQVTATLTAGTAAPVAGTGTALDAGVGLSGLGVSAGEWAGLRAELGRVGNNLNQAVRVTNSSGVNPARVAEMADAAQGTRVAVAGLLAAVRAATGEGRRWRRWWGPGRWASSWPTRTRNAASRSGFGWRRSGCTRSELPGTGRCWRSG